MLQRAVACCSVLQCVAVCCNVIGLGYERGQGVHCISFCMHLRDMMHTGNIAFVSMYMNEPRTLHMGDMTDSYD